MCTSQIKMEDRASPGNTNVCTMVVDGTDCRIQEPTPFSSAWYSHKFHRAGLRYEMATSIDTGLIVWISGPFPCGVFPDVTIFRRDLMALLGPHEMMHADSGYRGELAHIITQSSPINAWMKVMNGLTRAWHEKVNGKLKRFNVLDHSFRHNRQEHGECFMAVASLVQLNMLMAEKPDNNMYNEQW